MKGNPLRAAGRAASGGWAVAPTLRWRRGEPAIASAASTRSAGGASNHSNASGSAPHAIRSSRGAARSTRAISGSRCGRNRSAAGQSRRTRPGPSRAARPARWSAESCVTRSSDRLSTPRCGVVPRHLHLSGVDHDRHAWHGQRRLGDVRGQDDPSPRRDPRIAASCASPSSDPCSATTSRPDAAAAASTPPRARSISRRPGRKHSTAPAARNQLADRVADGLRRRVLDGQRMRGAGHVRTGAPSRKRATSPTSSVADMTTMRRSCERATPAWPGPDRGRHGRFARGTRPARSW